MYIYTRRGEAKREEWMGYKKDRLVFTGVESPYQFDRPFSRIKNSCTIFQTLFKK